VTAASRKTYFNKKNELKAEGLLKPVDPIKLMSAGQSEEVDLELLRRKFEAEQGGQDDDNDEGKQAGEEEK
jgi:hypothetical protein